MTVSFRTPFSGPAPLDRVDQIDHERLLRTLESRIDQRSHELTEQLLRLEHQFELARIQLELRTWLILASIPVAGVLLVIVLTAVLRR
jgi:hypothetical protein